MLTNCYDNLVFPRERRSAALGHAAFLDLVSLSGTPYNFRFAGSVYVRRYVAVSVPFSSGIFIDYQVRV